MPVHSLCTQDGLHCQVLLILILVGLFRFPCSGGREFSVFRWRQPPSLRHPPCGMFSIRNGYACDDVVSLVTSASPSAICTDDVILLASAFLLDVDFGG